MISDRRGYVTDASVGIKLCVAEASSDLAEALFQQRFAKPPVLLFVPDLFYIECANILWKHVRRFGHPADRAQRSMEMLRALQLIRTSTESLSSDALRIALGHEISAYDACYVALAEREGVPLITADQKLIRKLVGSNHKVQPLESLGLPAPSTGL